MLFIVVDARTGFDARYAQRPEPLGIKKVMDAVVSVTFNRYSFETMNLMRTRVKRWENEVRNTRCKVALAIPDCEKFDVDLVELSFRARQGRRRSASTWTACRPRSRCHPSRSSGCAAPLTCWWKSPPELRVFLEESAKSARQSARVGVHRQRHP